MPAAKGWQRWPTSLVQRLNLETTLQGHLACVNCLEWNQSGSLLISGSDDGNCIVWDPFLGKQKARIDTGHDGNIFSVKFLPNSSDTFIASCSSPSEVKVRSIIGNGDLLMDCRFCHIDRVKSLATHPNEPNLIWSAGEEGYIMQYDIRQSHTCRPSKPQNLLIDLSTAGLTLAAKCLAINPIRDEMLAVGSNDLFIRLYDRRFLNGSPTAYFTPGHLINKSSQNYFGCTYLAFSSDGSELLANLHAEQVYLFNTYEPCKAHRSFVATVKPLILDFPTRTITTTTTTTTTATTAAVATATATTTTATTTTEKQPNAKLRPYYHWQKNRKLAYTAELPERHLDFFEDLQTRLKEKATINMAEFQKINELLIETKNCLALYHIRAGALIQRGWRGDYYQAIRDCCSALALNPLDYTSIIYLAYAYYYIGDRNSLTGLLDFLASMETLKEDAGDKELQRIRHFVAHLLREPDSPNSWVVCDNFLEINQMPSYTMLSNNRHHHHHQKAPSYCQGNNNNNNRAFNYADPSGIAFDYTARYCGHCNLNTDIKEANFFGHNGEFIIAGSDDGAFYIWDKETTNIVKAVHGDMQVLNCLQPHPSICMLATSGIEPSVKIWSPSGKTNRDVSSLESRCAQNQDFIKSDPLEAMIMMLYPDRGD